MFIKLNQNADHGFDEPLGLLSDCHRRIERFLLVLLVIAHEDKGQPLPDERQSMLRQALDYFTTAAPRHTADEEESLFPRLAGSGHPDARDATAMVERLGSDHRAAETRHGTVDELGREWLRDGTLSPAKVQTLIENLEALNEMYRAHIALEDRELFPAAGRILGQAELEGIGREMAGRRGVKYRAEMEQ